MRKPPDHQEGGLMMSKPSTRSGRWLLLPWLLLLPFAVALLVAALKTGGLLQQVLDIVVKLVARP